MKSVVYQWEHRSSEEKLHVGITRKLHSHKIEKIVLSFLYFFRNFKTNI